MRVIFFICLLIVAACGNKPTPPAPVIDGLNLKEYELVSYGDNFQHAIKKNELNEIIEEGDFLDGHRHGPWLEYYVKSRFIKSSINYYKGSKQGPALTMNEHGKVMVKANYYQGKLDGQKLVYNNLIKITEDSNYKNGKLDGRRLLYYEDGNIKEDANYKDGQRHGSTKWYNTNSDLMYEYIYENGKKISETTK